ncbi:hypothetical protein BS78_02G304200 [Paspalum vaginatum]|nr:hypothetical protein BS78_02G304200 [Paspalum vaginatum]
MALKASSVDNRTRSTVSLCIVIGMCCFFYTIGAWRKSGCGKGDSIALEITKRTDCTVLPNLSFDTHHSKAGGSSSDLVSPVKKFKPCPDHYTDYIPCQYQNRAMKFPRENMNYRERHCPAQKEKLHCLIPPPKGYVAPFPWPKSRDYVPFANCPYKSLTVEKAIQNWVQYEGNVFRFPGGGTQFPQGADKYIDQLASVIPIANGTIRTALDTGCGVASWGAYLLKRNVLAMSFAPRDSHEAQVQFALERGGPAVIGVLGTIKLPYPSRAFDMAHCSRCLIPWGANDGMYMMEVDRVNYKGWQRTKKDLEAEQNRIEEIAELLCWEKVSEKESCPSRQDESTVQMCESRNPDDVWYKKMKACVTPLPDVKDESEVAGGAIKPFPGRLNAVPPRIANGLVPGVSSQAFQKDNKMWKKHVKAYSTVNKYLLTGRYRNIMDMNAGFGGFAAAIESPKYSVAFSTYPRTYDLIHASGLFTLYKNKCSMEDILLEMDRILRPEGAVIVRDDVDILTKVNSLAQGMRWNTKMVNHEDGPFVREKILYAVKQYWVGGNQTAVT